jgi:hypothetical protein
MLRSVALVRTGVPLKCRLLDEPHGITSQGGILRSHCREILKSFEHNYSYFGDLYPYSTLR